MEAEFINLTPENLAAEHLCCIIREKKPHLGVEAKRAWLAARLPEGHVFRKLHQKATVFIEYAPLEKAWVPVVGDNYLYIYCLWVTGESRGHGYGRALMDYCLADALAQGKAGVCMLGSKKQKTWLSDQSFAKKFGFETADTTESGDEPFDDCNAYYGACRCREGEPFRYWIGVLMPPDAAVPAGYDSFSLDAGDIAVCWVYGKEPDVYTYDCLSRVKSEGYEWAAGKDGVYTCFERYVCPRFTEPDEKGNVILDMCFYVK